ncbi:hypothetical protein Tcan_18511 [Toxocara canis]|uniref:Uncharacterized protein n=1 Tax=Toxocara canis TaxID=6265 RepID=A0A0B2W315_TOXCA|nr:hypothetical protein Tcan_18511 [Toxocara canis]
MSVTTHFPDCCSDTNSDSIKKKRSKRAKKKERSGKTKSKKSKTKQKKGGGFCSCSKKHGKQKHRSERSKPTTPTPQLTAQAKPKLPPVVLPPPTALMPTIPSQSSQKPKAEAGDTPQSTVSTGKTSATSATATETSTPTSSTTTTINTTTKDNDEVDVETDGALEQPRQTFVVQKYTHEGRTIRYFDHKMIYHVDDRPPTFFPPTIKQFLAYQRRMKAVPLKKHEEMVKYLFVVSFSFIANIC